MKVVTLNTRKFKGDILVTNNENCGTSPARGGMSIYDVTDATHITPLAIGKGDTNGGTLAFARQIHSVFAWQAGQAGVHVHRRRRRDHRRRHHGDHRPA